MDVSIFLDRLAKVRKTGPDTWQALCPAHEDKTPSLSIREVERENCSTGGRMILVHCFAGCDAHSIVSAVGLELSDLFPPKQHHCKPLKRPFPATECLRASAMESLVVAAAAKALANGEQLSPEDMERLLVAASRLQGAVSASGVGHGR
jgi:hypothetical protein